MRFLDNLSNPARISCPQLMSDFPPPACPSTMTDAAPPLDAEAEKAAAAASRADARARRIAAAVERSKREYLPEHAYTERGVSAILIHF